MKMMVKENVIGIIGLGQMGGGIAANLIRAGYSVVGYDEKAEAVRGFIRAGGRAVESSNAILSGCDIVVTCVEGRDSIRLADTVLLPDARPGQIFIDHSTVPVPETCRIGKAFTDKEAGYIDAPISGGKAGAAAGMLRIFVGGEKTMAEYCWPLFEVIGNGDKVVYCGPIGTGQVAKVVQQLTARFPDVARLEVMMFGLRSGLDLEVLMRSLDITPDSDDPYARLCNAVRSGDIERFSFEFAEWAYYLEAAREQGFHMPILEALFAFCKEGDKTTADALGRPEPSIWNELMRSS